MAKAPAKKKPKPRAKAKKPAAKAKPSAAPAVKAIKAAVAALPPKGDHAVVKRAATPKGLGVPGRPLGAPAKPLKPVDVWNAKVEANGDLWRRLAKPSPKGGKS